MSRIIDKAATGRLRQHAPRVLIVEDDRVSQAIQERLLRTHGMDIRTAHNGIQALEICMEWNPSVVLADWMMPEMDGIELAQAIKDNPNMVSTYIIMITGKAEITDKVEALDKGVDDYLVKPFCDEELLARIRVGLRFYALQEQLKQMSITDPLTGLFNRRYLEHVLEGEVSRAARYGEMLCILMVDCDKFKHINDTFGHFCGDAVLRYAANLLCDIVRDSDMVARYGGDEFVVLLPKTTLEACDTLIKRIHEFSADESFIWDGKPIPLSFSVGAAEFDYNEQNSAQKMLKEADKQMYAEKSSKQQSKPLV